MFRVLPARSLARCLAPLACLALAACGPLLEPITASCGGSALELSALQGTGNISPRLNERATVEGLVTLVTADATPPGFYLQAARPDADALSSDGLFVRASVELLSELERGQRVRARGRVAELGGVTALGELELLEPCAVERLEPPRVELGATEDAERYESMLVHSPETWTLIDTAELESAGRVLVSVRGRSFGPGHPLGQASASRHWALSGLADDLGDWLQAGTVSEHLRLGARVEGLTALVRPGSPGLLLGAEAVFRAPPAPAAPARPPGALRVAALNLDNYFSELDERGASSARELERQRAKLVALLQQLDADILALSELGNPPVATAASRAAHTSLSDLLAGLDAAAPAELRYQVSESSAPPDGTLRSAIAYRSRQLQAAGGAWFASDPAFRRAPLLQRFSSASGGFTLVVVHLKSKLCSGGAELVGSEGCGAAQRLEEARALLSLLSELPAEQQDEVLVLGDFNADVLEAPLRELRAGGLQDLLAGLPPEQRYSYVFEGRAAQLDHALAGPALAARLRGAHLWHINVDEPPLLGYELSHAERAYAPDARRASDHDPLLIDLAP